jgi:hypothetical protein
MTRFIETNALIYSNKETIKPNTKEDKLKH